LVLFAYGMTIGNAIYPLFVIFAVVGSFGVARWLWQKLAPHLASDKRGSWRAVGLLIAPIPTRSWSPLVAIVLVAFSVILLARARQHTPVGWLYPPSHPPLIDFLASNIRFRSDDSFRGRYLDMSFTIPLETGKIPKGSSLAYALMVSAFDHV